MPLFTDTAAALAELRSTRLQLAGSMLPDVSALSEAFMARKLRAAEAEVSRKLECYLAPTEVFSGAEPTPDELAALADAPYVVEPAYDMPADFFSVSRWGSLMLRHKPVLALRSLRVQHPALAATGYDIPREWLQVDGRSGVVSIVPGAGVGVAVPLTVVTMQAIGSGMNVPHMLRLRYTAGLAANHPLIEDVRDLVLRAAVLRLVQDTMPGQSGSISADGLSQSTSTDVGKLQEALDSELHSLRDALLGPVWGVL